METPEKMARADIGDVAFYYDTGAEGAVADSTAAAIVTAMDMMPKVLSGGINTIALTSQSYGGEGYHVVASTDPVGNTMTFYGNQVPTAKSVVHEFAHNFLTDHIGSYEDLQKSPYGVFDYSGDNVPDEQSPYEIRATNLEEDFVESCALYVTDNANFKANYPLRYAIIDKYMKGEY